MIILERIQKSYLYYTSNFNLVNHSFKILFQTLFCAKLRLYSTFFVYNKETRRVSTTARMYQNEPVEGIVDLAKWRSSSEGAQCIQSYAIFSYIFYNPTNLTLFSFSVFNQSIMSCNIVIISFLLLCKLLITSSS